VVPGPRAGASTREDSTGEPVSRGLERFGASGGHDVIGSQLAMRAADRCSGSQDLGSSIGIDSVEA